MEYYVVQINKQELYVLAYLKNNVKKGNHLYKNLKHATQHSILFNDVHN